MLAGDVKSLSNCDLILYCVFFLVTDDKGRFMKAGGISKKIMKCTQICESRMRNVTFSLVNFFLCLMYCFVFAYKGEIKRKQQIY